MVSGYLRLRQGLIPGQPLVVVVGGGCGVVRKEGPSLFGPFGRPSRGGLPFLVSPGWGENFPLLPRFRGRNLSRRTDLTGLCGDDGADRLSSYVV